MENRGPNNSRAAAIKIFYDEKWAKNVWMMRRWNLILWPMTKDLWFWWKVIKRENVLKCYESISLETWMNVLQRSERAELDIFWIPWHVSSSMKWWWLSRIVLQMMMCVSSEREKMSPIIDEQWIMQTPIKDSSMTLFYVCSRVRLYLFKSKLFFFFFIHSSASSHRWILTFLLPKLLS